MGRHFAKAFSIGALLSRLQRGNLVANRSTVRRRISAVEKMSIVPVLRVSDGTPGPKSWRGSRWAGKAAAVHLAAPRRLGQWAARRN
jgi:hypothetical protein